MGQGIDPSNPLYRPGGSPSDTSDAPALAEAASTFSSTIARAPDAQMPQPAKAIDVDLDLDFSADDKPTSAISDVTAGNVAQAKYDNTIKLNKSVGENPMEMDFDLSDAAPLSATPEGNAYTTPEISLSMDGVSLTEPEPRSGGKFAATGSMPVQPGAAPEKDSGMMDFDLGSLSLDLDASTAGGLSEGPSVENKDPLGTKLALAEEFVSIGDEDGARALIEEVVAESSGEMRAKAQRALASLS
jgi:pilus assembly protein FimV